MLTAEGTSSPASKPGSDRESVSAELNNRNHIILVFGGLESLLNAASVVNDSITQSGYKLRDRRITIPDLPNMLEILFAKSGSETGLRAGGCENIVDLALQTSGRSIDMHLNLNHSAGFNLCEGMTPF